MRAEAESTAVRVDRLEREVDYLETQNPAPPCVEVDETLMDKQVATAKQRKNEKYTKLTGEELPWLPGGWSCLRGTPTIPSPPQSRCPPAMAGALCPNGASQVSLAPDSPLAWELHPSPRLEAGVSPKPLGQGWGEGACGMGAPGDFSMPPRMHLNPFSEVPWQFPVGQSEKPARGSSSPAAGPGCSQALITGVMPYLLLQIAATPSPASGP